MYTSIPANLSSWWASDGFDRDRSELLVRTRPAIGFAGRDAVESAA